MLWGPSFPSQQLPPSQSHSSVRSGWGGPGLTASWGNPPPCAHLGPGRGGPPPQNCRERRRDRTAQPCPCSRPAELSLFAHAGVWVRVLLYAHIVPCMHMWCCTCIAYTELPLSGMWMWVPGAAVCVCVPCVCTCGALFCMLCCTHTVLWVCAVLRVLTWGCAHTVLSCMV